jgi:hypothetical protein
MASIRMRLSALGVAGLLLWLGTPGGAYSLGGQRWTSDIVMHLQLGSGSSTLIDGNTSWNQVAENALALWNPFLRDVSFGVVRESTVGMARGNDVNNVFFADDVYGDPFGSSVLAVTLSTYRVSNGSFVETDVIFNSGRSWDSYRGNQRNASGAGRLFDLRRVALHEFGHALGLDHPDQAGQSVSAIMNSTIGNLDSLTSDDTDGAMAIYGGVSSPNTAPTVTASCNPCTVEAGRTTTLTATATDADGDALSYRWAAASGTISSATDANTVWTAPLQTGAVTATVTVEDGRGGSTTGTAVLQVVFLDTLRAGTSLVAGQALTSTGGRYRLVYQSDGNLVLYDSLDGAAQWQSGTGGTSTGNVAMQSDGNVVMYDAQGTVLWTTGTAGNANAILVVQTDGNLVVYSPNVQALWTRHDTSASAPAPTPAPTPSPIPTPTPAPTTTSTSVIAEGSSSLAVLTLLAVPFTTDAAGTINATVDWTFSTNDVDLYLTRGTNPCTADQFNNRTCAFLDSAESATDRPETVSAPDLAAGAYTLYIGNFGPTEESVGYQVTLTTSSGTSALAPAAPLSPVPTTSGIKHLVSRIVTVR